MKSFLMLKILFSGAKDFASSSEKSSHSVISSAADNQRRGSVPCESNVLSRGVNGKRRNPKKILRRRSSSGAEILTPIASESKESTSNNKSGTSVWNRFKREWTPRGDSDVLLTRRRGSLPIEVLSIGLGKF